MPRSLRNLLGPTALAAVLLSQMAWVSPTNFWGHDEWVIQYLLSIGVIDVPHANRPVSLIWELPIPLLMPDDFRAWTVLYGLYALGSALLLGAICRRLVPARPLLAFTVPALFLVWSPSDPFRLACVERTEYIAFTFGTLLASWAFVESWTRRSETLLAAGILVAFVTVRSYEGTLPLVLVWPLGVAWALRERSRDFARWAATWLSFAGLAALLVVMPVLVPIGPSYQQRIGFDPDPWRVLGRFANQYAFHLGPLVQPSLAELAVPAVAIAAAIFLAGAWLVRHVTPETRDGTSDCRSMLLGLALAGAGYVLFTFNVETGAWRKEFLAGPWIALFLGSAASFTASWAREHWRQPAQALLVAVVVAMGTGRTMQMQGVWDHLSFYGVQTSLLRGLTTAVPDVRPHTLFVLLDTGGAWRSTFGFRLASRYLYEGRASGWAYGTPMAMFPSRFTVLGVVSDPWPDVQQAWREPPTLHRFEEIVVVRHGPEGRVKVAPSWPAELPPLPAGARYDPSSRILPVSGSYPARAILTRPAARIAADSAKPTSDTARPSQTLRAL